MGNPQEEYVFRREENRRYICEEIHGKNPFHPTEDILAFVYYIKSSGDIVFKDNGNSKFLTCNLKNYYGGVEESCIGTLYSRMSAEEQKDFLEIFPSISHLFSKRRLD